MATPDLNVIVVIAALAAFLILVTALKYAVPDNFSRTRLGMTAFFIFIVFTLTVSFWQYALVSLQFTVPAAAVGLVVGWAVGARGAQARLRAMGVRQYMEHFAHIHLNTEGVQWWSLINFYSVAGALLLINLVGLSNVIYRGDAPWALAASVLGAFLLGSIVPYLAHLWSLKQTSAPTPTLRTQEEGPQASL